jgi:hypothetical protein
MFWVKFLEKSTFCVKNTLRHTSCCFQGNWTHTIFIECSFIAREYSEFHWINLRKIGAHCSSLLSIVKEHEKIALRNCNLREMTEGRIQNDDAMHIFSSLFMNNLRRTRYHCVLFYEGDTSTVICLHGNVEYLLLK